VEEGLSFGREEWFREVFEESFEVVLEEVENEEDAAVC
jgi:hypothetical protein